MSILEFVKLAGDRERSKAGRKASSWPVARLAIVTNFTDDLLEKVLTGMCIAEGIEPEIFTVPFKQYIFELKNPGSGLARFKPDLTFVFFDMNPYVASEFTTDPGHAKEVISDISRFAASLSNGSIVVHTLAEPASTQHNRIFRSHALKSIAQEFNSGLKAISEERQNVFLIDTAGLIRTVGERHARDLRSHFAWSQPFNNEFLLSVAREWMAYVRTSKGKVRKCLVLDLDNVLWGGVVGETGPLGIELGTEYPGSAYREFQRILLDFYERGIILAVNSRNNPGDVDEVFDKNPHMLLKRSHFASIVANWQTKAENLRTIAKDLNIGLDSLVFIDDDPLNRDMVKKELPEVLVPEWSLPPEEYGRALLEIDAFHGMRLTAEDAERGKMYAAERARKEVSQTTTDPAEYLKTLGIEMDMSVNQKDLIPRLAQLTQKTNQFNLTTYRSSEQELASWILEGGLLYAGDIRDKFGPYGVTIFAAVRLKDRDQADLSIFLMSCRVMGRMIEFAFMHEMLMDLKRRGFKKLTARFIQSEKNMPAKDFLTEAGGKQMGEGTAYEFSLAKVPKRSEAPITVSFKA